MITYGFSQQGRSHVDKGVVCQDYHKIILLKNGWCVLIVADGVGSAKYSEYGSEIATETVAQYCKDNVVFDMNAEQLIEMLKQAYRMALLKVHQHCDKVKGNIEDYDTTLTTAIYTGQDIYYGHAGDGGIIVRDFYGNYEMITNPQKGTDGISVRPLRSGADSWEFGRTEKKVMAVLLATDGMLDTLLPPLLNIAQINVNPLFKPNGQMHVYVTMAEFLMNPDSVYHNNEIDNPEQFLKCFLNNGITSNQFNQCLQNAYSNMFDKSTSLAICKTVSQYNYSIWKIGKVTDDRTIVCAMNDIQKVHNADAEYYAEPDWRVLQNRFDQLAYPSLYEGAVINAATQCAKVDLKVEKTNERGIVSQSNSEDVLIRDKMEKSNRGKSIGTDSEDKLQKRIINIMALIVAVLVVGCTFQGMKIVYNHVAFKQAKVSEYEIEKGKETQDVKSTQERKKEQIVKEKKTDQAESDRQVTEQSTTRGVEEKKKVCFSLMGKQYSFPCELEELKRAYPELVEEEPGVYECSLSEGRLKIKIEISPVKDADNTEHRDGAIESEKRVQVQSIQIELDNAGHAEQDEQRSVADVQIGEVYVAELGMSQINLDRIQEELSKNKIISKKNGDNYMITYNEIICAISVENGIVKRIRLENNVNNRTYVCNYSSKQAER